MCRVLQSTSCLCLLAALVYASLFLLVGLSVFILRLLKFSASVLLPSCAIDWFLMTSWFILCCRPFL